MKDTFTAVVPPAPVDVEATLIERARAAFGGTLRGGFTLAQMVAGEDHEPFPLVRRRGA